MNDPQQFPDPNTQPSSQMSQDSPIVPDQFDPTNASQQASTPLQDEPTSDSQVVEPPQNVSSDVQSQPSSQNTVSVIAGSSEVMKLAEKYQVNQGKPHFPLNTLRLVYLIFAESIAVTSPEIVQKRAEDILKLIPQVQALFDARTSHRAENAEATLGSEWEAIQEPLQNIFQVVDTPQIHQTAEYMFSYVFPLQDTLLLSLYEDLSGEKKFSPQDIYTIFHIRSMDSIFYSGLVGEIIRRDVPADQLPANFQLALNYKLNALYQLNDLVDAIVYAKDDMESKNFSPFEMIRKVSSSADEAKQMIRTIATNFEKRISTFPLGQQTEQLLNEFGHQLISVIGGRAPQQAEEAVAE